MLIIGIIFLVKKNNEQKNKYLPFAVLSEFELSSNLQPNPSEYLIKTLQHQKVYNDNVNLATIEGDYKRYPLDKMIQPTSIVAVNAHNPQQTLAAWHVQIGSPGLNWLWPDGTSAYWVCPVNAITHPVVVIKGTFPRARYMSLYSYDGININNISNMGKGLTKFEIKNVNICNSTIPGNCAGLVDYEIEPDEDSKNPFKDASYNSNFDSCNYTVYFISPNYEGILPASKNILPLTTTNSNSALITLRIYAPFNPLGCNSRSYDNTKSFDTRGCSNEGIRTFIPSGSRDPRAINFSPCSISDKTCIEDGMAFEIERTYPKDCYKYVGNNQYCICLDDNPTSECGQYIDKTIKYYSNNKANLKSFCQNAPNLVDGISYCVDNIKLPNGKMGKDVTANEFCRSKDNLCNYVKDTRLQQCATKKLYESTNPACTSFKNPTNLHRINRDQTGCKPDFAKMLCECNGEKKEKCDSLSKIQQTFG